MSNRITVIIPTLNEARGIEPTIKEILSFLDEPCILVVDGGSTNGTQQIASNLRAKIISQFDKGKGKAISRALQYLEMAPNYRNDKKWLVITDGDFSYPAVYINDMIRILEKNPDVGMVTGAQGISYLASKSFIDHLRKVLTRPYYLMHHALVVIHRLLNGVYMEDPLTGQRVIRYDCIRSFRPHASGFDIEVEMNHYISRKGYNIVEVPIVARKRIGGTKKFTVSKWSEIILRMIIMALEKVEEKGKARKNFSPKSGC